MIRKLLFLLSFIISINVKAGNKIRFYFNHQVDNSVSTGVNAAYLNNCVADTLVAYISRSKYSIDIAQYDYVQGSFANIATAVNSAYLRGVQVRWIYDGSAGSSGLSLLNAGINTLGSPTSSDYGIMHNKFMIIDGGSSDPNDAIVWTGSFDWETEQFNTDHNNAVIIQDSALAHAYIAEFNMMWGSAGLAPDLTLSEFGPYKTDLGRHIFTIEGNEVELYFSPSDGTNSHIQSTISSANTDLYFGMYTFTDNTDASMIVSKYTSGVYVAGIDDSYSNSYSPYGTFTSGLGANFKVYYSPGIYHNKFLIVDPSNTCSDPLVLTGSHNWTESADTKNDENTLIIHNDTAANIYYQSFYADFTALGGALTAVNGCTTATPVSNASEAFTALYPNPANGNVTIQYQLASSQNVTVAIYNVTGQKIASIVTNELQQQGRHTYNYTVNDNGVCFVQFSLGNNQYTKKLVVTGE